MISSISVAMFWFLINFLLCENYFCEGFDPADELRRLNSEINSQPGFIVQFDTSSCSKKSGAKAVFPLGVCSAVWKGGTPLNPSSLPTTTLPLSSNPTSHSTLSPSQVPTSVSTTIKPTFSNSFAPSGTFPSIVPTLVTTANPSTNYPTLNPTSLTPTSLSSSSNPTNNPSNTPTSIPSKPPTVIPSGLPTNIPSTAPTFTPTTSPSNSPTSSLPTVMPSSPPTGSPTMTPSTAPSGAPTSSVPPSTMPTVSPSSVSPTAVPTPTPTARPSSSPSISPSTTSPSTIAPSISPTFRPSNTPSLEPSFSPSSKAYPTVLPTLFPSNFPSYTPSNSPSYTPSAGSGSSLKICQYSQYCISTSDCVPGNLCTGNYPYFTQCVPDSSQYLTSNCVQDYGHCSNPGTDACCDPGSSCTSSGYSQCVQPSAGNGCISPGGFPSRRSLVSAEDSQVTLTAQAISSAQIVATVHPKGYKLRLALYSDDSCTHLAAEEEIEGTGGSWCQAQGQHKYLLTDYDLFAPKWHGLVRNNFVNLVRYFNHSSQFLPGPADPRPGIISSSLQRPLHVCQPISIESYPQYVSAILDSCWTTGNQIKAFMRLYSSQQCVGSAAWEGNLVYSLTDAQYDTGTGTSYYLSCVK